MSFVYYPKNIGKKISKKSFNLDKNSDQLRYLKQVLSKKTIIRVYGLAGVGKGTLSKNLSDILEIPNLESSMILRAATFGYLKLNLELNQKNTKTVFDKIDIKVVNNNLVFSFENQFLEKKDLKSPIIDKNVTNFSSNKFVRERFDQTLDKIVQETFKSSCVADGRGALEPYLVKAENLGIKVIRILLDSDDETKAERYYQSFIATKKNKNPNFFEDLSHKQEFLEEFEKTVIARNKKDIENILDKKIGLISEDSALIDTSDLSPKEVLETTLDFIQKSLQTN
jgi:cytidylate kinase